MRIKHPVAYIFCLLFIVAFNGQAMFFKPDSLYLKAFPLKFSVRTIAGFKEFSITISNNSKVANQIQRISYKPNNGLIGGIGVSYKNVLLSYYFQVKGTEMSEERFGKTSINDYQINLTTRYLFLSGYHKTFNGFYVAKPKESFPEWVEGEPNPMRSDISCTTKGVETILNLNPNKYSLNASLKLTEQQIRRVFSPLIYANYSSFSVSGDSSLIPSHLRNSFFEGNELFKSEFKGWSLQPGVAYGFIINKWFVNPMVFAGFGYLQKDLFFSNQVTRNYKDYYFRLSAKLNCGYNSDFLFSGIIIDWSEMFLPEKNLMIRTENFNIMLMAGFRF